jgi:hypothetical protein
MEKEFVPPTESLALKELGFDEPCLAGRSTSSGSLEYYSRPLITNDSFTVDAPLYQQGFRWFRERYQLYSFIKEEYEYGGITPTYYITGKRQADIPGGPFNTYEEAELACLRKLIEIVKEK